jgi:hypothetical protein
MTHQLAYVITKPVDTDRLIEKILLHGSPAKKGRTAFSFDFYEKLFDDEPAQLKKIKKAISRDFQRFRDRFAQKLRVKDLVGMNKEAHRIRPIVKNLAFGELSLSLDKLRAHQQYQPELRTDARHALKLTAQLLAALNQKK